MRIADARSPITKAWSGDAARADAMRYAGGNIDTPAAQAKYKSFFLVVDGDPANTSSYKFPYKRLVNGSPQTDPDGLAAAKAAAHGARSGKSNAAASSAASKVKKSKLEKRVAKLQKMLENLGPEGFKPRDSSETLEYTVTKALDEERYTFGPLYTPGEVDEHGEFTKALELQRATWNYVRSGQRTIHKQHDVTKAIGEVVEIAHWPYEHEIELMLPGREVRKALMPAGTVYAGVIWTPEAWPLVKGGAITGYSMGGRAMRVQSGEILPPMRKSSD